MTIGRRSELDALSLTIREQLDTVCDRFERTWISGGRPRIEAFVNEWEGSQPSALFRELLHVELDHLRRTGRTPTREEYRERFPQFARIVDEVFNGIATAETAPRQSTPGGGGLNIRCPHCHHHVKLVADAPLRDIVCSSCGSNFSLLEDDDATRTARTVSTIAHFELIERLGVGGFGSVWKARDVELDRAVAIKIPRKGQLEPNEVGQFLREARAAAQLRHPNIVGIHEVGRDGDTIYIVSDLIRGVPLSQLLESYQLNSREAAELCIKIAEALHHAHEAGVIHRDLKPHNIMIDDNDEPHLMDFGLARRELGEITMTVDGQVLGTPAYMSPEQAQGGAHKADRRADIYSLGVILFQLLTGELPFRGSARMLLHQVINDEPPRPRKLNSSVPADLQTICLKCLEKSPSKRYQSAQDAADEFRSYLQGRPILARPVNRFQKTWRWCKRKPSVAILAASLALALVTGTSVATVLWLREAAARKQSEELAQRNQRVVDAFVAAFESPDPANEGVTSSMTALQVLEKALATLKDDGELQDDPLTKATLLEAMGSSMSALGAYQKAITAHQLSRDLRKTRLGFEHPDTLTSMNNLASAHASAGRLSKALPLNEETLKLMKAKLGPDHPSTLTSMNNLADGYQAAGRVEEALPLYEELLRITKTKLGPEHRQTLISMNNLATGYQAAGRVEEAVSLLIETLRLARAKLGNEHPDTLSSMNNLAAGHQAAGRVEKAVPLFEETLSLRKDKLGPDHPHTLISMNTLANGYQAAGRVEEALPLYEETLRITQAKLGPDHPQTLTSMDYLAGGYEAAGRLGEALPLYEEILSRREVRLGPEHPQTLISMAYLAGGYLAVGRPEQALPLYKKALRITEAKLGPDHPQTLTSMNGIAFALIQKRDFEEAKPIVEVWINRLDAQRSPAKLARAETYRAVCQLELGRVAEAIDAAKIALGMKEIEDLERLRARTVLAAAMATQEVSGAEEQLVNATQELRKRLPEIQPKKRWYIPRACERVVKMYEAAKQPDKVHQWRAQLAGVNAEIERLRQPKELTSESAELDPQTTITQVRV